MLSKEEAASVITTIVGKVEEVFAVINQFQESRPGSIAYERLEEAIMWLNVMCHNIALKVKPVDGELISANN